VTRIAGVTVALAATALVSGAVLASYPWVHSVLLLAVLRGYRVIWYTAAALAALGGSIAAAASRDGRPVTPAPARARFLHPAAVSAAAAARSSLAKFLPYLVLACGAWWSAG
jgi:hypothetical protein